MEWVEVRGETLEAAKEEALDQLGVAHDDAEFEIVQEPESRWMGLKKTEARVRARVRPTQPRPKRDGRNNRRQRRAVGAMAARTSSAAGRARAAAATRAAVVAEASATAVAATAVSRRRAPKVRHRRIARTSSPRATVVRSRHPLAISGMAGKRRSQ